MSSLDGMTRPAAVAGLFYPAGAGLLRETVRRLLAEAEDLHLQDVRALIVPHAGYAYSGPVAASAYRQVQGRKISRVIILAPSHYGHFRGVAVVPGGSFVTPLGRVPIDPLARALAESPPFFPERPVPVQLPSWAKTTPFERGLSQGLPHMWEHSIEVQLPFLQEAIGTFTLVPALFGEVDAREAARVLARFLDNTTLVVASSDLSHYLPHEEAVLVDRQCIGAIRQLDVDGVREADACGRLPMATVVYLAREFGWEPRILDYRTSGDTSGDYEAVVGYVAVAFCASEKISQVSMTCHEAEAGNRGEGGEATAGSHLKDAKTEEAKPWDLSPEEREILLKLAREAIWSAVTGNPPPRVEVWRLPERLRQPAACFVTLKRGGQLRGCIGTLIPREPLYEAVIRRAESAALADHRFPPVRPEELGDLEVEISVLGPSRPIRGATPEEILSQIQPGRHGVILRVAGQHATFLPQVWEHFPDKEEFLAKLAQKAGLPQDAWLWPEAELEVYEAEVISEEGRA